MNFDGTADMLIKQGNECGVSKYVVQSVATAPHQVKRINDFIVKSVEKYPDKLIGFGSLHPDMKGMEEEIDRLIASLEAKDKTYIKILSYEFADEYVSFRIFSQGKWDIKL